MNRLRMEHPAGLSAAEREIERIEGRRKKLVESIMDGVPASEVRGEFNANTRISRQCCRPPQMRRGRQKRATSRCKFGIVAGLEA